MQKDTELRKAPSAVLDHLATILDINEDWKKFMSRIPKDLRSERFEPKYNNEHIRRIEEYANVTKLSHTNILFNEWATSGQVRPTLETLLDILTKAEMIRAADYLTTLLNKAPITRPPVGPAARIDVTGFLNNNNTTEQYIESRKLLNGSSNGTLETGCRASTKKLESAAPLMFFPPTRDIMPNFEDLKGHSTQMVQNVSDFMKFSEEVPPALPSAEYIPHFSMLQKQEVDNSSISSLSGGSTAVSESSPSANTTTHSDASQHLQVPVAASNNYYEQVDKEILQDPKLIKFSYVNDLEAVTNRFRDTPTGSGGFGDVYKGNHKIHGILAIKRAHNKQIFKTTDIMKIFNTEVKSLSALRHLNVVGILGYSLDGPTPCIVCEYIEGGSLLENIKEKVLNKVQRMNIMKGTADGLKHIHDTEKPVTSMPGSLTIDSSSKQYFMHGDVKSANILITKDFIPKLCDLGLSKQCATTFHTESIVGTSAYMAPERFHGTVTPKGDVYSYGIVLLELLTGLEPIITGNETLNIKYYVEEKCPNDDITSVLDPVVGDWPEAEKIYDLAKLCIETKKNLRPTMEVICQKLQEITTAEKRVFYADV